MVISKGCRLRAKGQIVKFDTEDGEKEFLIKPLKNEQLLEIQELWDKKESKEAQNKANVLFVKYSINRDPKIVDGTEEPFTDEEIEQMETNFLIQIMETAAKVNGLEKAMEFQKKKMEFSTNPDGSLTSPKKEIPRQVLS